MVKTIRNIGNKGQVLVFVVATMAIALSIGISYSLRTLSSISRTSTSDTSSRVLAAAEGGVERYLSKSISDLETASLLPQPVEIINFNGSGGDTVKTQASVYVTKYGETSPSEKFTINVKQGKVAQVNLSGYGSANLDICWISTQPGVKDSDLYYSVYNYRASTDTASVLKKWGIKSFVSHSGFPSGYANNFEVSSTNTLCDSDSKNYHRITGLSAGPGFAKYLRFYSINNDSVVEIYPSGSNSLPYQGYMIKSIGKLNNLTTSQQISKTVTVLKSLPYLPAMFDFGIYSDSGTVQ